MSFSSLLINSDLKQVSMLIVMLKHKILTIRAKQLEKTFRTILYKPLAILFALLQLSLFLFIF